MHKHDRLMRKVLDEAGGIFGLARIADESPDPQKKAVAMGLLADIDTLADGGPGSGNFGHAGREGVRGGSAAGEGGGGSGGGSNGNGGGGESSAPVKSISPNGSGGGSVSSGIEKAFGGIPEGYKTKEQKQRFCEKQMESTKKKMEKSKEQADYYEKAYSNGSMNGKLSERQQLKLASEARAEAEKYSNELKEQKKAYQSEFGEKKETPKGNTSEYGELVTTYKDGTKGYEKKDTDLTPEEHKQWMGAMDNWVKSEAMDQLAKTGLKRSDVDIKINRDEGTAIIKTWRKDPKSPSGISNDFYDVKLKGTRTTTVKPDGRVRTWVSPKSVKLVYRGSNQY